MKYPKRKQNLLNVDRPYLTTLSERARPVFGTKTTMTPCAGCARL